jgi:opacity protein-like surface antigen
MRIARNRTPALVLGLLLACCAQTALAADLFFATRVGTSWGTGEGTGELDLAGVGGSGEDKDASPLYGATFGIAVPLSDLMPYSMSLPSFDVPIWPGRAIHFTGSEDFRFPGWRTLLEVETLWGRDLDFETESGSALNPFRSEVESASFLANFRLDVPIQAPLTALFGRLPMIEPMTLYTGGGAGVSWNEITTKGPANFGSDDTFDFAYQYMAGIGYALSDSLHLSVGWRYFDMGELSLDIADVNTGTYDLEVGAHEVTTSLRFHFYHVPFFGRE